MSPEFKDGYAVGTVNSASQDGEADYFASLGAFSGAGADFGANPYIARRTERGWVTSGLVPAPTGGEIWAAIEEMSPSLSQFEYTVVPGSASIALLTSPTGTVWVREADGSFAQTSPQLTTTGGSVFSPEVLGGSSDLSRLVLVNPSDNLSNHYVPQGCGGPLVDEKHEGAELFEVEGCAVRLVAVDPQGKEISHWCTTDLGLSNAGNSAFGAVSQPDAKEIIFSAQINSAGPTANCSEGSVYPRELFARISGTATLEISKPAMTYCTEAPCSTAAGETPKEAFFQGASEDGSKVFFTTTQPLVNEDKDGSNDLYMATVGCASGSEGEACGSEPREVTSLTQVSHDSNPGQAAEVEPHVTAVSPDGSHVYFVARGVLTGEANALGQTAALHADNLYAYEHDERYPTGHTAFVADLCSGPEASDATSDARCPASLNGNTAEKGNVNDRGLWSFGESAEAQTTSDGAVLVFGTYATLITSGVEADADTSRDVYRYDAEDGRLQRVSTGEAGFDGNGNNSEFGASIAHASFKGSLQTQYELSTRAITDDGSAIVFSTTEPLSPRAINGRSDVYVWHDGDARMISNGSAVQDDEGAVITPSGRDIFFSSSSGLVPGDADGLRDVYDARIGGGFPLAPAAHEPCSGDACQGPLTNPAPLLVPGSVSQPAGGNMATPVVKVKPKSTTVRCKHGYKRDKHGRCVKVKRKEGKKARKSARKVTRGGRGR